MLGPSWQGEENSKFLDTRAGAERSEKPQNRQVEKLLGWWANYGRRKLVLALGL
jgi:hypothetical protein